MQELSTCFCLRMCLSHAGLVSKWMHGSHYIFAYRFSSTYATLCFRDKNKSTFLQNFSPKRWTSRRLVWCWQQLVGDEPLADVHGTCGIQSATIADIRRATLYTVQWSIWREGHRRASPISVSWHRLLVLCHGERKRKKSACGMWIWQENVRALVSRWHVKRCFSSSFVCCRVSTSNRPKDMTVLTCGRSGELDWQTRLPLIKSAWFLDWRTNKPKCPCDLHQHQAHSTTRTRLS